MKFAGGCLFLLVCSFFCAAAPAAAQITANCSNGCYGPKLGADALANTTVGQWGNPGNVVSYRFRAHHTGAVQSLHVYLIVDKPGYASGTGGTIQITFQTDDGTAAHNPSGKILATYVLTSPLTSLPSRYFPTFNFSTPPSLNQGQLYHIVFKNIDANPTANYLSVDALYLQNPYTPAQPTISDIDAAELLSSGGGSWQVRKGYLPIYQLNFTDGWTEGVGYMEAWIGAQQAFSGSGSGVREQFTASGAKQTVGKVAVRLARISGSDPLIVKLENADGSVIEQGSIPASSWTSTGKHMWVQYTFDTPRTLMPGQKYFLELSTASSSTYQIFPVRKGMDYWFADTTWWPDGYAQFKQNGAWVGWTQWGVTNRTDGDLQFYFEVASSGTAAPVISSVDTSNLTTSSATVSWATDQLASSQVEYGSTTAYGNVTTLDSTLANQHSQTISGLSPGTVYHYRVHSSNASGVESVSPDGTFTTVAAAPVISDVTAGNITATAAAVSWTTDQPASGQVDYGTTTAYGTSSALNTALSTSHSQALGPLVQGTVYHYRVRSKNAAGIEAISPDATFTTATMPAPLITGITAGNITTNSAVVSWQTDQPADGEVLFGTTTAYGSSTTYNPALANNHSQQLSGLAMGTLYHYQIRSANSAGSMALSPDATFTTTTVPPVISAVSAGNITQTGATIAWTTDQASTSQVDYGTTTAYGASTALSGAMVTAHSQALLNLAAGTVYHYRVRSRNAWGNLSVSPDATFTTAPPPPLIFNTALASLATNSATVSWQTDQNADGQIEFGTTAAYGSSTTYNPTLAIYHAQQLSGLVPGTVYHYRIRSANAAGLLSVSPDATFTTPGVPGPAISNVAVVSLLAGSAIVSWQTSQLADGQVEFGTSSSYGSSTTYNPLPAIYHAQQLTGLLPGTVYHYRIRSRNSLGGLTVTPDATFTTPR